MTDTNLHIYMNALFILLSVSILAFILIIHNLRGVEFPEKAIRLYNLYFIAGVIGWIGLWVREVAHLQMDLTFALIFYVLCGLLLLLAVAECADKRRNRLAVVIIHLLLIAGTLMLISDAERLTFQALYTLAVYPFIVYLSAGSGRRNRNIGGNIIAFAALLVIVAAAIELYSVHVLENFSFAYGLAVIGSSTGFVLVGIGFLTSILVNEHNKLTQLALKDPLTRLYNRRGMEHALGITLAESRRDGTCISAITLDIDHFKNINDTYGHDTGDQALQKFALAIEDHARPSDVCCRLGGEEFVIVLPHTGLDNASGVAERLRQHIEDLPFPCDGHTVNLTVSLGVAAHCNQVEIDDLLKDADKALYKAKFEGRNRVCVTEAEKRHPHHARPPEQRQSIKGDGGVK